MGPSSSGLTGGSFRLYWGSVSNSGISGFLKLKSGTKSKLRYFADMRIFKYQLVGYFCTCVKLGHERLPRVEELHEITIDVLEQEVLTHLVDQQRGLELTESATQLSQYLYFCTTLHKYFCTIKTTCSRSGHSAAAQTRGAPSYTYT